MKPKHLLHASSPNYPGRAGYALAIIRSTFLLCALLLTPLAFSADISGT